MICSMSAVVSGCLCGNVFSICSGIMLYRLSGSACNVGNCIAASMIACFHSGDWSLSQTDYWITMVQVCCCLKGVCLLIKPDSALLSLHSNIHVSLILNTAKSIPLKHIFFRYNYLNVCDNVVCVSARCMLLILTSSSRLHQPVLNIERRIVKKQNGRDPTMVSSSTFLGLSTTLK